MYGIGSQLVVLPFNVGLVFGFKYLLFVSLAPDIDSKPSWVVIVVDAVSFSSSFSF